MPIRLGQEFSGYAAPGRARHPPAGAVPRARSPSWRSAARRWARASTPIAEFPQRMAAVLAEDTGLSRSGRRRTPSRHGQPRRGRRGLGRPQDGGHQPLEHRQQHPLLASGPRCGIGEIRIPELQPGSSIMPGKVNPVIPEAVMMVAAQVVGNDATIAWANALGSNFDLNVMMPVIAYNLLQSIDLLTTAAEHLADKCVDAERVPRGPEASRACVRIEADAERCRQLIEQSLAMCTALAPRIGYDNAAAIAKAAYREGKTIREIAMELVGMAPEEVAARLGPPASADPAKKGEGIPTREEIEQLLDPVARRSEGPACEGASAMTDEHGEVTLETDHLEEVIDTPPPGQPVVVIQYRTRGFPGM